MISGKKKKKIIFLILYVHLFVFLKIAVKNAQRKIKLNKGPMMKMIMPTFNISIQIIMWKLNRIRILIMMKIEAQLLIITKKVQINPVNRHLANKEDIKIIEKLWITKFEKVVINYKKEN